MSLFNQNTIITNIASISILQSHEPIFTPFGSKRVLNDPVIVGDSDQQDSMIEDVLVVDAVVKNTRLVVVPSIGVETHNKRFSSQGIGKVWASVDVAVAWDKEMAVGFEAESSYAFVRVLWL